jgi:hypothetical protein
MSAHHSSVGRCPAAVGCLLALTLTLAARPAVADVLAVPEPAHSPPDPAFDAGSQPPPASNQTLARVVLLTTIAASLAGSAVLWWQSAEFADERAAAADAYVAAPYGSKAETLAAMRFEGANSDAVRTQIGASILLATALGVAGGTIWVW